MGEFTDIGQLALAVVAMLVGGVAWGARLESRSRSNTHRLDRVEGRMEHHVNAGVEVWALLGRLDERTKTMDNRMERIEERLNGKT